MGKEKLIKEQNRKWLISYILFHIVLFALFTASLNPTFKDVDELLSLLKSPSGFFPLLAFPIIIILDGVIHSDYKAMLIFLRVKYALPGHRAFSDIAKYDSRINYEKLISLYPKGLPVEPQDQNNEWYELYRQFSNRPVVYDSHKSFLLTRDLASLTFLLTPFCLIAHILWKTSPITILYHIILLICITIILCVASQNYGKRFVSNVLIEAIS